jgi:cytochrome b561
LLRGESLAEPINPWPSSLHKVAKDGVVMVGNTDTRWGGISRLFHWSLALVIVGMLAYGWWMNHLAPRPDRFFHRSIHADIGYLVLLLMVIRLIWRSINPVPALPADTPPWRRLAARVSHGALYGVTIVVALLGWAHSGAHKPDYSDWFGVFRVPQFTSPDKANADFYEDLHIYMAYVLIALVVIHVCAALYHYFFQRDDVLNRMALGEPVIDPAREPI